MSKHKRAIPLPSWSRDKMEMASYVPGHTWPHTWSPEARAKWFFDFLRTDLRALTPGQVLGMREDVWSFVRPGDVLETSWDPHLSPAEILEVLQRDARAGIQRVREGKRFELEKGIRYGIALEGNHIVRGSRRGALADLFRAAVMDTVQAFWERLHECPRCHNLFLKVGKQKYCSQICARRTHWDAFKARRPDRDHHREYAHRVRNRLGTNVRVSTKPRRKK